MLSVTYKVPEDVPISHSSRALLVIRNDFLPMACEVNGIGGASVMEFDIPTKVQCDCPGATRVASVSMLTCEPPRRLM